VASLPVYYCHRTPTGTHRPAPLVRGSRRRAPYRNLVDSRRRTAINRPKDCLIKEGTLQTEVLTIYGRVRKTGWLLASNRELTRGGVAGNVCELGSCAR
jgi:hypothetical protein